jgi:hypothetical protein
MQTPAHLLPRFPGLRKSAVAQTDLAQTDGSGDLYSLRLALLAPSASRVS